MFFFILLLAPLSCSYLGPHAVIISYVSSSPHAERCFEGDLDPTALGGVYLTRGPNVFDDNLLGVFGVASMVSETSVIDRVLVGDIGTVVPSHGLVIVAEASNFEPCKLCRDDDCRIELMANGDETRWLFGGEKHV